MKTTTAVLAAILLLASSVRSSSAGDDERLRVNWSPTVEQAQAFADSVVYDPDDKSIWDGSVKVERACNQPFLQAGTYEPILRTPLCAIETMSLEAQKQYERLEVTEDMIPDPGLEVIAMPPSGVARSFGYKVVLLKSTDRELVVRPAEKKVHAIPFGNRMGYQTEYNAIHALFTPEQIAQVQAEDPKGKGEFYIVTVNDLGEERETKLKTKHFKLLH